MFPIWDNDEDDENIVNIVKAMYGHFGDKWRWNESHWPAKGVLVSKTKGSEEDEEIYEDEEEEDKKQVKSGKRKALVCPEGPGKRAKHDGDGDDDTRAPSDYLIFEMEKKFNYVVEVLKECFIDFGIKLDSMNDKVTVLAADLAVVKKKVNGDSGDGGDDEKDKEKGGETDKKKNKKEEDEKKRKGSGKNGSSENEEKKNKKKKEEEKKKQEEKVDVEEKEEVEEKKEETEAVDEKKQEETEEGEGKEEAEGEGKEEVEGEGKEEAGEHREPDDNAPAAGDASDGVSLANPLSYHANIVEPVKRSERIKQKKAKLAKEME